MITSCTSLPATLCRGEGAADGGGAELRRGGGREHALECADGRAHGGGDDDLFAPWVLSMEFSVSVRGLSRGREGRD